VVKLIALYTKPDDPEAFLHYYFTSHAPLVEKTPGLAKIVVSRVDADSFGQPAPYFLMAEMHYPDRATFEAAMKSRVNLLAAKDLQGFAKGLVTFLICETAE
jgi:uncharacterized protein (TIGR02118 family)